MLSVLTFILTAIYVLACFFLIFVVLIQKGEGGGLGGIAGGGAVDMAFGAKADTTWKRATGIAATIFIVFSMLLAGLSREHSHARTAAETSPAGDVVTPAPAQ